jgi:hypothetical protein
VKFTTMAALDLRGASVVLSITRTQYHAGTLWCLWCVMLALYV